MTSRLVNVFATAVDPFIAAASPSGDGPGPALWSVLAAGVVLGAGIALVWRRRPAARLRTAPPKKHLTPAFVVNTLAEIKAALGREPAAAVRLIEALTAEFRLLERTSGEALIPVSQEVELCRSHLHVMSLRRGRWCSLRIENLEADAAVPPAVFLTLIEDALAHPPSGEGELVFTLRGTPRDDGGMAYEFFAPRGPLPGEASATATGDGAGLRYVEARLEGSFPGGWRLRAGAVDGGWRTVIELERPRGEAREPARVWARVG